MKKWMGAITAAALLTALAPVGASAAIEAPQADKQVEKQAEDRILVRFKSVDKAASVAAKHGVQVERTLGHGKSEWKLVKVPKGKQAEFLAKFQADADVAAAEPDVLMSSFTVPNDPNYSSQWHLPSIMAPQAWDITTGTSARTIAIIDTGIDLDHPDLAGKIVAGYDFVNNDAVADDDQGHGTHVAGIAAGLSNNGRQIAGVDWNAKLMPVKVLDSRGSGYTSDIIDGVYFAADNGAHVLNMSLGGGAATTAFQDAVNYAWNKGKITVAAAGNSNTSVKTYPAAYNNVIAVAALTSTNARASYSNYGSWVDVAAPGSSILSTAMGGGTTVMSGSSMAAPVVSGLISLMWSKNTSYSNSTIVNRLCSTSDAISGTGTYWLCGKVNAYKAVNGF